MICCVLFVEGTFNKFCLTVASANDEFLRRFNNDACTFVQGSHCPNRIIANLANHLGHFESDIDLKCTAIPTFTDFSSFVHYLSMFRPPSLGPVTYMDHLGSGSLPLWLISVASVFILLLCCKLFCCGVTFLLRCNLFCCVASVLVVL